MKQHRIEGDYREWIATALRQSPLLSTTGKATLEALLPHAKLLEFDAGEPVMREGNAAESFFLLLMGEASIYITDQTTGEAVELTRIKPVEAIGESALLTDSPRSASVVALKGSYFLEISSEGFNLLLDQVPVFSRKLSQSLATRLVAVEKRMPMPEVPRERLSVPPRELVQRLPDEFIRKERVLPLLDAEGTVTIGYVDKPTRQQLEAVRSAFAGRRVRSARIAARDFDDLLASLGMAAAPAAAPGATGAGGADMMKALVDQLAALTAGAGAGAGSAVAATARGPRPKRATLTTGVVASVNQLERIEPILRRMLDVGASDLHLSARQVARWRIDGDMHPITDFPTPAENEVYEIMKALIPDRALEEFQEHSDCDFAFALEGIARFRCNLFRDENGASAVFRLVPMTIPSMDQVGLPKGAQRLCELNQGLVLVCGPTGSGKSTTLGAMIDHINNTRRVHVVTIEDPIEFHHESKVAMITQREVGKNTSGFYRAMRASLREDPDIVLVGELRDPETMALAIETAQTGHLVFSTLHTNTAIGTIDRIIDMFPVEQHSQIRTSLSDVLKGVINQNLCRRIGGGRVGAFETLIVNSAVSNLIRQAKNNQIVTVMTTNKQAGNCMMNEDLESLVKNGTISTQEAVLRSPDRQDMRQRLGGAPAAPGR